MSNQPSDRVANAPDRNHASDADLARTSQPWTSSQLLAAWHRLELHECRTAADFARAVRTGLHLVSPDTVIVGVQAHIGSSTLSVGKVRVSMPTFNPSDGLTSLVALSDTLASLSEALVDGNAVFLHPLGSVVQWVKVVSSGTYLQLFGCQLLGLPKLVVGCDCSPDEALGVLEVLTRGELGSLPAIVATEGFRLLELTNVGTSHAQVVANTTIESLSVRVTDPLEGFVITTVPTHAHLARALDLVAGDLNGQPLATRTKLTSHQETVSLEHFVGVNTDWIARVPVVCGGHGLSVGVARSDVAVLDPVRCAVMSDGRRMPPGWVLRGESMFLPGLVAEHLGSATWALLQPTVRSAAPF